MSHPVSDLLALAQLAPLASQHHLSDYSKIKHGHRGSPVTYTPLSVHLPDLVRDLRQRQQTYADQVLWWPCPPAPPSPVIPADRQRAALAAGDPIPLPELHQQLSAALSESISLPHLDAHVKTSESHPINISPIIPPEALVPLSSHLTPCKQPSPVLFEIHAPYSLDRITTYPHSSPPPTPIPPLSGVINAALNTKLSSKLFLSLKRNLRLSDTKRDVTEPPHATSSSPSPRRLTTYALHPFSAHARPPTAPSPKSRPSKPPSQRPFRLGNLLLSSCPGKKVRLSGPVHGRSAVCRDLDVDLRRMRMLGARCVVCCLDDEELEFLIGASWTEYCQVAHREGLDVLRIPLPEGLAPLSPQSLDADLDRIIQSYTLQGISVLVHCRGGVGRAGLVACCWMLRLGLCGWIETGGDSDTKRDDAPFQWDNDTVVRRDTLQLVERVIEVVRRRRSVKAVETLEQVQFLVEYIDYLRTCGRDAV